MFGGIPLTYAFVKVQNDILKAIDNNRSVILLLLNLSAAFDTVDHSILLSRLQNRFGIRNIALSGFIRTFTHANSLFLLMELNRRRSIYPTRYYRVLCWDPYCILFIQVHWVP